MYISSNQTVYFGPSSSNYPVVGTVFTDDPITWLWTDGSWYCIEYPISNGYKRGYIHSNVVMMVPIMPDFTELISGASTKRVIAGGPTYYGPDSSHYPSAGSVGDQEEVYYLGYSENGFDLIEYYVDGTTQRKRAYFPGGFANNGDPIVTQMRYPQATKYGPSSSYQSNGSVSTAQTVTAVVASEDNLWVQIEYTTTSGQKNRGYVPVESVDVDSISELPHSRISSILVENSNGGTVYSGPSPSLYGTVCSLSSEARVFDLGYEEAGYRFIEYTVPGSQTKIRGYYPVISLKDLMSDYQIFTVLDPEIPSGLPMAGLSVNQGFNDIHTDINRGHLGYDLGGENDVIKPLFIGTVVDCTTDYGSANGAAVCVRHNVNGIEFYSTYCHMLYVYVTTGQQVTLNTTLGIVGGSGNGIKDAYPFHLHVCVYTGEPELSPNGYGSDSHKQTLEESSNNRYNGYYYGPDRSIHPRCGGLRFYDPYGVVTSEAAVIAKYH